MNNENDANDGFEAVRESHGSPKPHLTHVDERGEARMVDVGSKAESKREAVARGICYMQAATAEAIRNNMAAKGDVLAVARIAGILAAKKTDELIPLCHSVPLDAVSIEFTWPDERRLQVTARATCTGRTGVEMEALVATSIACLTVYDMCKAIDRTMSVQAVELLRKSGGVRGDYVRS